MKIDLNECKIVSPEGEERNKLYTMLGEVFEIEKDLFDSAINGDFEFCNWTPFSLYYGDEITGNVSIIGMKIWFNGELHDIYGIGSVATPEKFRKNGIAKYLMNHAMSEIDKTGFPAVLYTDLPMVYESHNFKTVLQSYKSFDTENLKSENSPGNHEYLFKLNIENVSFIKEIYENLYPNIDGKLHREEGVWEIIKNLYNPEKSQIILLENHKGYARFEYEKDRIMISELCCAPDDMESILYLLNEALLSTKERDCSAISLAFDKSHFIWDILKSKGVAVHEETGAQREVFMVRGPRGEDAGALGELFWSLADKF
ncbi:MAG: GNAT family N-acetyltransferase [Planctomycetota bacterium]|jgi:predicted acetyltransferase